MPDIQKSTKNKTKKGLSLKKKDQQPGGISVKITDPSQPAPVSRQTDNIAMGDNASLSSCGDAELQGICQVEDSLPDIQTHTKPAETDTSSVGQNDIIIAGDNDSLSSVENSEPSMHEDESCISFTDLANDPDLSWKTVRPGDENNDSRSNTSLQSVPDNDSEILTGESENDGIEDDSPFKGNLSNGKFLDTDRVVDILMKANDGLMNIPSGLKENVYFILDNEKNISKKENDKKSVFHDDCGVWDSGSGMSPKTPYLITSNGHLKKIFLRNKDGSAFNEKKGRRL